MDDLQVGSVVEGVVTGIKDYGIFVKINNDYSGLIHISEISNRYVNNINEYVSIGEHIYVLIKSIDYNNKRCVLSIKDINYRPNAEHKIRETLHGFATLKEQLPKWIESKNKELDEK